MIGQGQYIADYRTRLAACRTAEEIGPFWMREVPAMKAHGIDRLHQGWIEMYGQWHDRCGEILERAERGKALK